MHQATPKEIRNNLIVYDTNQDGMTALLIPMTISGKPLRAKLQVRVETLSDLSDLKKILHDQPQATYRGVYQIEVVVYVSNEDTLASFPQRWGLDVIPAIMQLVEVGDVGIVWEN